jgi:hypothetical protein
LRLLVNWFALWYTLGRTIAFRPADTRTRTAKIILFRRNRRVRVTQVC